MKKLIAVCAISGSIAFLTGACAEQPAEPPRRAAVFKPLFGASAPFNNAGQCLGNDAVTWGQLAGLQGITRPSDLNCTSRRAGRRRRLPAAAQPRTFASAFRISSVALCARPFASSAARTALSASASV